MFIPENDFWPTPLKSVDNSIERLNMVARAVGVVDPSVCVHYFISLVYTSYKSEGNPEGKANPGVPGLV